MKYRKPDVCCKASEHQKEGSIYLFGQESQPETYAVAEDLLLKGRGW